MEKIKKILVLGGNGMLGHMVKNYLTQKGLNVITTERKKNIKQNIFELDIISNHKEINNIIFKQKPDIIVNCIGRLVDSSLTNPKDAIFVNSFFPHYVASLSEEHSIKFIHISTDCVFNGENGPYIESSFKDEANYYGLSKNLGEVIDYKNSITIRTSIIGPEIRDNKTGLFHWVFSKKNKIDGYNKAFWSGVTTLELSKYIEDIILNDKFNNKLIHATNNSLISKHDLISLIIETFDLDLNLNADSKKSINKQLLDTSNQDYKFPSYFQKINEQRNWMINNKFLYNQNYPNLK